MKVSMSFPAGLILSLSLIMHACSKGNDDPDQVTDVEGNVYFTVRIGKQLWMSQNLKTTKYNDGTDIPEITDPVEWQNLTSSGLCWYDNDKVSHFDLIGPLYNGYVVSSGNVCPKGWHIPTFEEITELREFSDDTLSIGGFLKKNGTDTWSPPNIGADNSTGFGALPSGIRYYEGSYSSYSYFTGFWSSSEASDGNLWYFSLYYDDALLTLDNKSKNYGFSIRCLKDR